MLHLAEGSPRTHKSSMTHLGIRRQRSVKGVLLSSLYCSLLSVSVPMFQEFCHSSLVNFYRVCGVAPGWPGRLPHRRCSALGKQPISEMLALASWDPSGSGALAARSRTIDLEKISLFLWPSLHRVHKDFFWVLVWCLRGRCAEIFG